MGLRDGFCKSDPSVDALRSAFRHGIDLEDTRHAVRNAMVVEEIATARPATWFSGLLGPGACLKWS